MWCARVRRPAIAGRFVCSAGQRWVPGRETALPPLVTGQTAGGADFGAQDVTTGVDHAPFVDARELTPEGILDRRHPGGGGLSPGETITLDQGWPRWGGGVKSSENQQGQDPGRRRSRSGRSANSIARIGW